MNGSIPSGCSFGQAMVDQRPVFRISKKHPVRRKNQVLSKGGLIRPDKRKKVKFI